MNKFEKLGLSEELLKSINELGFEKPTPIQENIIPVILEGYDVIGQAQTGTGKTLAFSSILLTNLKERKKKPQAYILSPTRELTMQIHEELKKLGKYSSLRFACVYGGSGIEKQIKSIKKGVDIVVGTPGRMMDLMRRKVLQLDEVSYVVLDEADEMLNMGFVEDIETIISKTNPDHTTMLFSATMPEGIKKIAKKYMKPDYKHIQVKQKTITANTVKQYYFEVKQKDRFETLCRIIDSETVQSGIIFSHITFCLPYVILSVMPRLKQMNPNLYEAALDLGASPMQALRKVIIPEILPGMISGFMLAVTMSIDDFAVTIFTIGNEGLETLSTFIYADARKGGLTPELRPLSTIIFVLVLVMLIIINKRSEKNKKK